MTYGYWTARARVHLSDAVEQITAAPAGSDMDILALVMRRSAVYRQLERNVEILLRRTNIARGRGARRPMVSLFARFRERLHVTAADLTGMPSAMSQSPAAASLTSAVDCLGVGADILASHLLPQPRTPEAVQVRLGSGIAPAMADLARAGLDAVAVDQALLTWLTATAPPSAVAETAISSARRATTSSLPSILANVIATAPAGPRTTDGLTLARAIGPVAVPIETRTSAAASLRETRTWLWQNPTLLHAIHLRLGTAIGQHVSELAGSDADQAATRAWRRAVAFTDDINGSPPTDQSTHIANRLSQILSWVRAAPDRDDAASIHHLLADLPALADALHSGLRSASARGDLFIRRSKLVRGNDGIARAASTWRRATLADDEIIGLRAALSAATSSDAEQLPRSPARIAFQHSPQPGTTPIPRAPAPSTPAARRRGRA